MVDILVRTQEQLHTILNLLEPMREQLSKVEKAVEAHNARLGAYDASLSSIQEAWKTVVQRCDDLDKRQPYGNKIYVPMHGPGATGRQHFENFISDVARIRWGAQPKHFEKKMMMYSADGVQRANQVEGTTTAGGFLVPEQIAPEVLALIGEVGVARRICRIYAMTRKDMKLPVRNTGPLVYWPGEGVKPTTSTVTLLRPELNAKTMIALDELSEEVDMDSIVSLAALLTDLFSEAVALEEDKQAFNSATAPFVGVLQAVGVPEVTMPSTKVAFTDLAYNDVVNLKHAADSKVVQRGTYVFHQDTVGTMHKIKDNNGDPIWKEALGGGLVTGPPGTILGRPYYTTNAMPSNASSAVSTPFMTYGDFRYLGLGDRMQMQIDISSEAGFTEFTKWMRVVERVAFIVAIPGAFARLKTAAS